MENIHEYVQDVLLGNELDDAFDLGHSVSIELLWSARSERIRQAWSAQVEGILFYQEKVSRRI